ncbi:hypothetical protein LZ575_14360 [Antarcticibacterium sp. 1MA-6-2]|uniref:hypothetical protein n=1 Tax=Antarcticibacterium sp. 1MA-6-2 TaxID=2908210 RepID=UPI001F3D63B9|nr:hypothetical protein [Antarcticibacterium sp. 1MA-6-2]UJH90093.1 hypothetical protein LZ575_14360 [Antarcticibacterium sp. 1MA-6-2]
MDKNEIKNTAKKAAEKAAELWVAKKGLQWTGSILSAGIAIGASYLVYKYIRDHKDELKEKFSS